jgi:hypothetical protein
MIACYAAMEQIRTRAGAAVRDADTPAEVLARVADAGTVSTSATVTLTGLFREARYSLHPIGEEHRRSALAALDQLRSGVGDRDEDRHCCRRGGDGRTAGSIGTRGYGR